MGSAFTWFEKFTRTLERVAKEDQGRFAIAIIRYGTYDEEPDFSYPLDAIFESIRDDIDNSKRSRENGAKGGRGNKKGGFSNSETPLLTPLPEDENPPSQDAEAKPIQTNTNQASNKKKSSKRKSQFIPPTSDEVRTFAHDNDLPILEAEAEDFCDNYASQGWRLSNGNPMKDWKAAGRRWQRRNEKWQEERKRDKGAEDADLGEYSGLL